MGGNTEPNDMELECRIQGLKGIFLMFPLLSINLVPAANTVPFDKERGIISIEDI